MHPGGCHREASSLLQNAGCCLQALWELACQRCAPAVAIARQARSYRMRGVASSPLWELACQRCTPAFAIARQARSYRVRGVASDAEFYFCVPSSCSRLAWVRLLPAGTLRVSHTLPPMVEPWPMVMRPKIVAPA